MSNMLVPIIHLANICLEYIYLEYSDEAVEYPILMDTDDISIYACVCVLCVLIKDTKRKATKCIFKSSILLENA